MKLEFKEYKPKKIVNVHRHVDGPWFWGKYSAHPYIGCRSGCEFCYLRGSRYLGRRDPENFDTLIQVKVNAVDLLARELPNLELDVIAAGDWQQPAEDRYRLSRAMLKIVHQQNFPLFIVERSPLLTRDLDLLVEINNQSWVGVVLSISSLDPNLKRTFEPRSPGVKRRLETMQQLAEAGILVGTGLMPILPIIGDDEGHLEDVVRATKDHGGKFIMAGGLTMDGVQAQRTLDAAKSLEPGLEIKIRQLYSWPDDGNPQYGPPQDYNSRLGLLVRELCDRHGLLDRMPRYIAPGPSAINKRIAERLFLRTYDLELEMGNQYHIWAYRKAAWVVDECKESIAEIFQSDGESGLQKLPGIGKSISTQIGRWLKELPSEHT
jgi:DNA repair photolyase